MRKNGFQKNKNSPQNQKTKIKRDMKKEKRVYLYVKDKKRGGMKRIKINLKKK